MGLLDDAIRDHLELKRLGGADPSVVDREESEALDPVLGDDEAGSEADLQTSWESLHPEAGGEMIPAPAPPVDLPTTPGSMQQAEAPNAGQETAELDMGAVMGEQDGAGLLQTSAEVLADAGSSASVPSLEVRSEDAFD